MEVTHIIAVVFFNRVALQYALWAAILLAPLYAFALKPLVRCCRQCAAMKAATRSAERTALQPPAASKLHGTPVRLSAAGSKGFLSPASVGATQASFMPIFATAATVTPSYQARSRSSIGAQVAPLGPHDSTPNGHGSTRSLEVTGTALTLEEVGCRSVTQRFVSALCRHVRQRGSALFKSRDSTLRAALQSGELYLHRHSSLHLPSQNYFSHSLQEKYDKLNTTDASLEALYVRPAFQEWYAANREQLLRDMQLREAFAKWCNVATAFVLLVALLLLPAYSFSMQTNAMQWVSPLASVDDEAAVAAAPLAQLLATRLRYIQSRELAPRIATSTTLSSSRRRADAIAMATNAVKAAEYVSVVAAACALVTSCFMPRESCTTASVALVSFLLLVMESALVPKAAVKLGLGFLVVFTIVAMSVCRAAV
ncbi:nuclear transmembrane protein [Leishmania donovani]|uniref:Nuclear_transmembrane_protein_putative/GeneDB:Lmj F.35.0840 n=1 Tax=Leishmania donovani TaxID=5661 RepID=A0A504X5X8_LEIDO|nr:hypothetical protein, conserved [Leishmania donovani]TPP44362.1 hypothetical protein CGC21_5975 [Leishmania donovani]CAJ1992892.1 nuclear transmembrane protein [Leishmania donovani]CBZ37991.1 hypothetical protein, conserved [Leishmania donovani]VDZ48722.1 nuclear_transmembrane_protein_putative/GeneDB:LmjF.35.0840 [Leishmania donovani]